jgi:hypothetical protein
MTPPHLRLERIQRIMERLGMEEGEPIEHKLVTRAIGTAQKRVETRNFEIRKHLLEYDDVMNKQREIVYGLRHDILEGESQQERILEWAEELAEATVVRILFTGLSTPTTGISGGCTRRVTRNSTFGCRPRPTERWRPDRAKRSTPSCRRRWSDSTASASVRWDRSSSTASNAGSSSVCDGRTASSEV